MKLTKSRLKRIIAEEVSNLAKDDEKIKLSRKGMAKGKQAQKLRQTAKGITSGEIGGEFTNIERSLVQQISDVITNIAEAPDVDLGQYRAQINTILNRIKKLTGAEFAGSGDDEEK